MNDVADHDETDPATDPVDQDTTTKTEHGVETDAPDPVDQDTTTETEHGMETDDQRPGDGSDATARPAPPRRLVRSRDRKIAGVAGGVAEYFAIDPVIVRLGFVIAVFAGGTGLIAYAIAWLVLPDDDDEPTDPERRPVDRSTIVALALLALAVIIGVSDPFDGGVVTPLLLIGAGVYLLHQRPLDTDAPANAPAAPTSSVVAPPADAPTWQPGDGRVPPPPPLRSDTADEPARQRREPAIITRLTLSLLALWFAGAIAFDQLDWAEADASAVVAVGLLLVGGASLIASLVGGGRGLVPLGLLLALTLAVAVVLEPVIEDGIGDREHAVTDVTTLEPAYRLGIGQLDVDLSALEIPPGETATVEVELGIGEARVLIPPGVDLQLEGDVGMGELVILGDEENGIRNELSIDTDATDTTATLVVDLSVGIGSGRIERG